MKDFFKTTGGIILVLVLFIALVFGGGYLGLQYKKTIGKENVNIDRQIFEKSKSHVEGMADDLAKYKYEYETAENEVSKKAIADLIRDRFADFDAMDLNNPDLASFLQEIRRY